MPIRKTGSATGQITGIESKSELQKVAAQQDPRERQWSEQDERELAAENDRDEPTAV